MFVAMFSDVVVLDRNYWTSDWSVGSSLVRIAEVGGGVGIRCLPRTAAVVQINGIVTRA